MEVTKVFMVLATVLVTLATAMLLNHGAKSAELFSLYGIGTVLVVLFINFIKFKVWGIIYQRYHLSESYPLTALFFPMVYFVAIINNEAVLEWTKVVGVVCIMAGTIIMNKPTAIQ